MDYPVEPMGAKSPYAAMGATRAKMAPIDVTERVGMSYAPSPGPWYVADFPVPPAPTAPSLSHVIPPTGTQPSLHYTIPPTGAQPPSLHYTIPPTVAYPLATVPTFVKAREAAAKIFYPIPPTNGEEKEPMKWYTWVLIAIGAVLVIRALKK